MTALESLCVVTHYWPLVYLPGRNCKLAHLSMWLDERWGTGVWEIYWQPTAEDMQGLTEFLERNDDDG